MIFSTLLAVALASIAQCAPSQAPFDFHDTSVASPASESSGSGIINTWSLNPSGDAAIIRVTARDRADKSSSDDLHLLAINAQYTVPTVRYGAAHPRAVYTFISNDTFLTLSPSSDDTHDQPRPEGQDYATDWTLTSQRMNYTTLPPAWLPSASEPQLISEIGLDGDVIELVYASETKTTIVHVSSSYEGRGVAGALVLLQLEEDKTGNTGVRRPHVVQTPAIVGEVVTNGTHLAYAACTIASSSKKTFTELYLLDLRYPSGRPERMKTHGRDAISGIAFGADGQLGWLAGPSQEPKELWLHTKNQAFPIPLEDFDLSPNKVIFSKDGDAIYLLAPHRRQDQDHAQDAQSLFHLWTPHHPPITPIRPIRIPSNGTIYSATHVGITPLDHAHLIGVKSDERRREGKELWVISHAPHEDPTYNYENIRLTHFTDK